jgi:peptidoglycan-N-acetylglucosamine deacetylase
MMRRPLHLLIACISALTLLDSFQSASAQNPASAESAGCWTPEALAGKADEKAIHRGPYNASIEPAGEAVSLPQLPGNMRGSIRGVKLSHGEKLVALTFDLCENADEIAGYDAEIVDTLRRLGVKATFFPSGKWLLDHTERAEQLLADPLFQVGAHSWTHRNFRLLKEDQVKADLALDLKADQRVRQSLHAKECYRPDLSKSDADHAAVFRFPFGTCNAESLKAVNDAGLLAIQWDLPSGDPAKAQSADAIRKGVAASAKSGSIIVMHANGRGWHTAEALPHLIEELRKRGFEFATVSELLAKGEPIIADSCYELRPGDNMKYDKLFPVERPADRQRSTGSDGASETKPDKEELRH